jgi:phosphomannomutase
MGIEYRKLQNGSDIRGVAMEGVEGQPVTLSTEAITNIAKAFVLFLQERTGKSDLRLSIGRDSRLSGESLLKAAAEGILAMGADLADFGLASTPSMFMSTVTKGFEVFYEKRRAGEERHRSDSRQRAGRRVHPRRRAR